MTTEEVMPTEEGLDDGSIIGQLRAHRAELAESSKPFERLIPGYEGLLKIILKQIPWEDANARVKRAAKSKDKLADLNAAADILIMGCHEILVREGGEYIHFADGFDDLFAEKMGIEAKTARAVLLATYENDFAVVSQNNEYFEWLRGATEEDLEEYEGN